MASRHGPLLAQRQGFGPGLTGQGEFFYPATNLPPPDPRTDPKTTDRIAEEAVCFIEANRDKPFFAYLPFLAVHIPIGARPTWWRSTSVKRPMPRPTRGDRSTAGRRGWCKISPSTPRWSSKMDSAIGRVLAAIDRCGLAQRTIVIFMSDNGGLSTAEGQPTSNLPFRAGKGWVYEGGIREPWIIRAPGVTKPGSVCDTPVVSTDFYPTISIWPACLWRPINTATA